MRLLTDSFSSRRIIFMAITLAWFGLGMSPLRGEPRREAPFAFTDEADRPLSVGTTLRVCTWNIEWFPAGQRDGQERNTALQVAAVADIIGEIQPHILITQETRNLGALRLLNRNLNPPRFSHLAATRFYAENLEDQLDDKVRQELGLLSHLPWKWIEEIDFAPLRGRDKPARGWLVAGFEVKGHTITIYNGHFKSNYGAENPEDRRRNIAKRRAAIDELQRDLDHRRLDPIRDKIIVAGDFNTDFFSKDFSDEEVFSQLDKMGFRHTAIGLSSEARVTLPAREGEPWPSSTMDYILISAGWKADGATAKVLQRGASKRSEVFGGDEPGLASDHYPVYVDLPLNAP